MADIVDLIFAEHVRIRKLIGKLDSALAGAGPAGPGSDPDLVWAALARFLRFHIDAAEEIAYQALATAQPDAALAIVQACQANIDICEAVEEARLSQPGSRAWHMAVRAACREAQSHITCVESGPLDRFRIHTAPAVRRDLGSQWMAFMAARALDSPMAGVPAMDLSQWHHRW